MALSVPFIIVIRQCDDEFRTEIKREAERVASSRHDGEFLCGMFHPIPQVSWARHTE